MDGKAEQIYGEERQRQWFSVQSCIPKFEATVGAEHIWSQEAVVSFGSLTQMPGPKGLGHLLLLSQAISRELGERGAARMLTGIHTGSQCLHGKDLVLESSCQAHKVIYSFLLSSTVLFLNINSSLQNTRRLVSGIPQGMEPPEPGQSTNSKQQQLLFPGTIKCRYVVFFMLKSRQNFFNNLNM